MKAINKLLVMILMAMICIPMGVSADNAEKTVSDGNTFVTKYGAVAIIDIDGKMVTFTDSKPFIDEHDRTMIPIRAVAEMLDCEVEWDEIAREVSLSKDNTDVLIKIDGRNMIVNNKTVDNIRKIRKFYLDFCLFCIDNAHILWYNEYTIT